MNLLVGNTVYMDHAATTPLRPGVLEAMLPYLTERYGNPSSVHAAGRRARAALDDARDLIADELGCRAADVVFTSGGSEADNLALLGFARAHRERGRHILVSAVEHHAVLAAAEALAEEGFAVEHIPVDANCRVAPETVAERLRPDTLLVSVMHANNEVGAVQPVQEIASLCRQRNVAFHTDAVQTVGHIPVRMDRLGVGALSLSAHKFGGPKGVGALLAGKEYRFAPLIYGGGQEREKRAGTENVAGIVGMAVALQAAAAEREAEAARLAALAQELRQGLALIPGATLTIAAGEVLPGHVHVCFAGLDGASLVQGLDQAGIAASAGPACASGAVQLSHVLVAMGVPRHLAAGALRLTLGPGSTEEDVKRVLAVLNDLVRRLQSL